MSTKLKTPGIFFLSIVLIVNSYGQSNYSFPDTLNKKKLYTVIGVETGTYLAGLAFLSFIWYSDQERAPFHWYNDSKGYLQMDKLGHAYGAYRYSSAAYIALRKVGLDKKRSLIYGGPIGLVFQTPVEIFDGLYEGWGFSWPDMIANTFGATIFTMQEAFFDDQIVKMKFSYSPSGYPKYHSILGDTYLESFFLDYNAHTYWFSVNLKKTTTFEKIPPWLNLAFGYSANGMIKEYENPQYYQGEPFPDLERYRQFLFSFDIDFAKVKTNKIWLRKTFNAINLIKIPFPAVEINRIDGIKINPFYF